MNAALNDMNTITEYNQDNFHEFEYYAGLAIIRFYADWCAPCVQSKPVFQHLAAQRSKQIKFGQVNIDQSPILTLRYQVFGLPSILIFDHGKIIKRMTGLLSLKQYSTLIDELQPTNVESDSD